MFNGSKGTVVGFAFQKDVPQDIMPKPSTFHTLMNREIPTVLVKMDLDIGYSIISDKPNIIPFVAVCKMEDKYLKIFHRWQIPLEPAFACTTHKMQGTTAKFGAVILPSQNKPFARGLEYVAPSRPTELNNLYLLGPLTEVHYSAFPQERHEITQEYDRLRSAFSTPN